MKDTTTSTWPQRAARWIRTHRTAAIATAAAVMIVAGGGTVTGTAMSKQAAVDEWRTTRAKLTATAKTADTVQGRYDAARTQTQATAALAKELVDARGGAMDDRLWKTFDAASDAATKVLTGETSLQLVRVPKLAGTDRGAYETATAVGRKALSSNSARVATVTSSTSELEQARSAVLDAGGKIAAAVKEDEEYRKGKYPDATQQTKDAVHRAAGTAIRALQQHPEEDLVLTNTRDYLKTVYAVKKSDAEQAAARKAAIDAQAAAAAAAAQSSGSAGSSNTAGRGAGGGSSSTGRSTGFSGSGGGYTPAPSRGSSSGGSSATGGGAPAPSTGGGSTGGSGSSGGGSTARPPQYALMHSTRVASCNPGEYTYSFGPNIGSMPSRYLSVSTSWNGSDWVYSGTTCGS